MDVNIPSPDDPDLAVTLLGGTVVTIVPSLIVRTNDTRRHGVYPTSGGATVVSPDQTSQGFTIR